MCLLAEGEGVSELLGKNQHQPVGFFIVNLLYASKLICKTALLKIFFHRFELLKETYL